MTRLILAFLVLLSASYFTRPRADEAHMLQYHADADQDDWLRSLKRPNNTGTCCSLNDCLPTYADWRGGQWWAVVRGVMTPIPPGVVVDDPFSFDGEAWVCYNPSTILCFVPPLSSY